MFYREEVRSKQKCFMKRCIRLPMLSKAFSSLKLLHLNQICKGTSFTHLIHWQSKAFSSLNFLHFNQICKGTSLTHLIVKIFSCHITYQILSIMELEHKDFITTMEQVHPWLTSQKNGKKRDFIKDIIITFRVDSHH